MKRSTIIAMIEGASVGVVMSNVYYHFGWPVWSVLLLDIIGCIVVISVQLVIDVKREEYLLNAMRVNWKN